jgi:hypothetical protein
MPITPVSEVLRRPGFRTAIPGIGKRIRGNMQKGRYSFRHCHSCPLPLAAWPLDKPRGWTRIVNDELEKDPLASLRTSVRRSRPFRADAWVAAMARRLNLTSTLRSVGRPRGRAAEAK